MRCHEHTRSKEHQACWFLAGFGYEPVIQRGNSVWYKSPFRTEKEASFKVDLHKELWYDFGLGKGGDIITLAKEIYRTQDIGYVLQCIEDKRAVLKPVTVSCPFEKAYPAFQDLKIIPLANRILLTYLKERCIDLETARKYAGKPILNGMGRIILPSLFLIFPEGTKSGTGISRLVLLPRTLVASLARRKAGFAIFWGVYGFSVFQTGFSIFGRGGLYSVEFCQ